jgi:pimeloyl-ACP methyl ester carboxylesterase
MSLEVNSDRRWFLRTSAMALVASDLAMISPAKAEVNETAAETVSPIKRGTHTSFASLKQIEAGVLSIGYAEAGPVDGPVVILLHGWPYDIYAYVDVAPALASAGYRVIIPYLRGFGSTRFLSTEAFRNGEQLVFAIDTVALMDALKINRAILAGYDYGGRAANIVAVLWPERCKALVSGQGYLIVNYKANQRPLPPKDELAIWFQYYFGTERGRLGYSENLHDFNKFMWHWLSPQWEFDDATYERTAASFENPDHVAVVIHNFRTRYGLGNGDPQYDALNAKLQTFPVISVPTITIATDFDGANANGTSYRKQFSGKYEHRIFPGFGHNVPQEDPQGFAQAVIDVDGFS